MVVGDELGLPFEQPSLHLFGVVGTEVGGFGRAQIGEQGVDGLLGIALVAADHPVGPRLIQPTT